MPLPLYPSSLPPTWQRSLVGTPCQRGHEHALLLHIHIVRQHWHVSMPAHRRAAAAAGGWAEKALQPAPHRPSRQTAGLQVAQGEGHGCASTCWGLPASSGYRPPSNHCSRHSKSPCFLDLCPSLRVALSKNAQRQAPAQHTSPWKMNRAYLILTKHKSPCSNVSTATHQAFVGHGPQSPRRAAGSAAACGQLQGPPQTRPPGIPPPAPRRPHQ